MSPAEQFPESRLPVQAELLSVSEVAAIFRVSEMTIYRLVQSGELKHVRVGNSYQILADSVDARLSNRSSMFDRIARLMAAEPGAVTRTRALHSRQQPDNCCEWCSQDGRPVPWPCTPARVAHRAAHLADETGDRWRIA
jgi:excisionase family DNA binding protein